MAALRPSVLACIRSAVGEDCIGGSCAPNSASFVQAMLRLEAPQTVPAVLAETRRDGPFFLPYGCALVAVTLLYFGWSFCMGGALAPGSETVSQPAERQQLGESVEKDPVVDNEATIVRKPWFGVLILLCALMMNPGFAPQYVHNLLGGFIWTWTVDLRVHIIIGFVWLILGSVQAASAVLGVLLGTNSWRKWHRRLGYLALCLCIFTGTSGIVIDMVRNSATVQIAGIFPGAFMMCNMVAGVAAARRREYTDHRVFMLFAVAWTANIGFARNVNLAIDHFYNCSAMLPLGGSAGLFIVLGFSMVVFALPLCVFGEKLRRIALFNIPPAVGMVVLDVWTQYMTACRCGVLYEIVKMVRQ